MSDKPEVKSDTVLNLTENEIKYICSQYNIGKLTKIGNRFEGSNANIKITTTEGCYVIRLFCAEPQRIEYINRLTGVLKSSGIPALIPLQDNQGRLYMHISKNRAIQMSKFVEANKFDFSIKHYYSSGKMLRKFHDALKDSPEGPSPKTSVYPSNISLLEGLKKLQKYAGKIPSEQLHLVNTLYIKTVEACDSTCRYLPSTIIHGDWNPNNHLFDTKGNVCCILDFDFMQRAERIYDIAYMVWFCIITQDNYSFLRAFLKGYGAITEQEKDFIPCLIIKICLFFMCNASMSMNPIVELQQQIDQKNPIINWILSGRGINEIKSLFNS